MTTIARTEITTQVAIIGAGPSGFLAGARLAGTHRRRVLVLDREKVAGGIPRHSDHLGYGMRDMHTLYQRSRVREAADLNCRIRCDTVVFTGDWIPDHELARSAGIEIDASTRGPLVDPSLHTSRAGVFAAGNVVHPVDTADIAAVDGTFVADEVARYLTGSRPPRGSALRLRPGSGLRWIAPGLIRDATFGPPRGRLLAWTDELVRFPKVTVSQGGCVVAEKRLVWPASPGRVFRIPAHILDRVDHRGGDVISDIANASAMSVSRPDSAVVNVG